MSERFKAIVDESDYEDDNCSDNGVIEEREKGNKKKRRKARRLLHGGCNYKNGLRRAKKVVFSPFNKCQKLIRRYTKSFSSSSSSHITNSTSNLSRNNSASTIGNSCCLCSSKPQTLDAPLKGIDKNHEDLKFLIEKNDFFSKECDTHFW